jgi:universal stress protein E
MSPIKHILVIADPTAQVQHCVEKGASLARAFGAELELFVCDYQSGLLASGGLPDEVVQAALQERRQQLVEQLRVLAEPLRQAGLQVVTDCSFHERLHTGVIRKVQASGADLVIKDTHFHGVLRRALFTNSDWHLIRECTVPLLLTKPSAWHPHLRVAAALDPGHADDKPASLDRQLLEMTESLAAAMDGEVLAVHAFDPMPLVAGMVSTANGIGTAPFIDVAFIESLRQFHKAAFDGVLAGYPAFAGRAKVIEGSPIAELPGYLARKEVDVLVAGAVSRSALQRFVVGSTAERLLDRLPCDILVVKPVQAMQTAVPVAD